MRERVSYDLNPWFATWTRPRAALRYVLNSDPDRWIFVLSVVAGFARSLDGASSESMGDEYPLLAIFALALIGGSISGLVYVYVFGFLLRWTGGWLGGRAIYVETRAALAVPHVIIGWSLLLWIPLLALLGREMFTTEMPRVEAQPVLALVVLAIMAVEVVLTIWAFVAFLHCLSEAQGFSVWRALANTLLAVLVIALPALLVGLAALALGA